MAKKEPNYRITAYWDDNTADYVFVLERDQGSSFKKPEDVAEGDRAWANRQAEHYGIELPKSLQENQATPTTVSSLPSTVQSTTPLAVPTTPTYPITPTTPGATS